MKVLMLNPPGEYIIAGARWASRIWGRLKYTPFPFHMAYAMAVLEKNGIEVKFMDCVSEHKNREELLAEIGKFGPDLIVMETSAPSYKQDLETINPWRGGIPIAIVGHHGTAEYKKMVNDYDYVILGEYDYSLLELCEHMQGKRERFPTGVATLQNKNRVKRRPLIENINELPWPARHLMDIWSYSEPVSRGKNCVLISSRGCRWNCMYCTVPLFYGKVCLRLRDPKDVVDEMEYLWAKYNPTELYLDDDSFATDESHVFAICDEIERRRLHSKPINMKWGAMSDAKISNKCLQRLSEVGFKLLKIGSESIHQGILKRIPKPITKDDIERVVNKCKEVGIRIHLDWVLGLPGSTAQLDKETVEFNDEMNPSSCQFSVFTPYPGTRAYELCKKNGWLIGDDWDMFNASGGVVVSYPNYTDDEIRHVFWGAVTGWKKSLITKRWRTLWHHIYGDYKRYGIVSTMSLVADQVKQVLIRR